VLGHRFSGLVAIQPGHRLVTTGLYGCCPPPQLSGSARQLAGLCARLSFGGRRASHGTTYSAAPRAHTRGREAAALAVRR
jgi:hypothetical protein